MTDGKHADVTEKVIEAFFNVYNTLMNLRHLCPSVYPEKADTRREACI